MAVGAVLRDGHNLVQIVSGAAVLQSLHRFEELPPEELREFLLIMNEVMWCEIDRRTRKSGFISRVVRIIDCSNITLMPLFQLKAFAPHCEHVVQSYPIPVLKSLIINAPRWIRLGINAVTPFFNPTVLKHWHVHVGDSTPLVTAIVAKSELPQRYGGDLPPGAWPLEADEVDARIKSGKWAFLLEGGEEQRGVQEAVPAVVRLEGEGGQEATAIDSPPTVPREPLLSTAGAASTKESTRICRGWGRSCKGLFRPPIESTQEAPDAGPLDVRQPLSYEEALKVNPYAWAKQRAAVARRPA